MSRDFNGSSQYAAYTSSAPVTDAPFTIAGWFYATPTGSDVFFEITDSGGTNAGRVRIEVADDGWLTAGVNSNSGSASAGDYVSTSQWVHVAMIVNTSSPYITVVTAGDWAGRGTSTTQYTPVSLSRVQLGMRYYYGTPDNYYDGMLAHWAVWNSALSQAQIEGLHGGGSSGDNPLAVQAANLVAYWPLAGDASPEPDDKGSYDLTLTGSPTQGASDPTVDAPPSAGAPRQMMHLMRMMRG